MLLLPLFSTSLQAAHVICKGTRSQLRMAAEDVQRQIKVITTTRKKQAYMEVLEVANKMKKVQDLQQALRCVMVGSNYTVWHYRSSAQHRCSCWFSDVHVPF